ncbi:hypothetical protein [Reinekea sp. G2M2-21]|uniref:hypothetical protein n=1 Tax=Reinekea sp. G2M2-21 TaxID=2788942 RepID=UPI0018AB849F|nr:hypothetical protein [Reinekea sp. G2M2-21]
MRFLPDEVHKLDFSDLRNLIRRGQIFGIKREYSHYGNEATWRLFVEVLRPNGKTEALLVGAPFYTELEMWRAFGDATVPENPAEYVHYMPNSYPRKAICGVGRFAKLCGIDTTADLDEFLASEKRCLKCHIVLRIEGKAGPD